MCILVADSHCMAKPTQYREAVILQLRERDSASGVSLERDACPLTQLWSCPQGSLSSASPLTTPPLPGDSLQVPPGQIILRLLGAA